MNQALAQLSRNLGRDIIDEPRRATTINRNCPRCFAEPGQNCVTVSGNAAAKFHNNR